MELVDFHLLFRWCVGLGMDDQIWVPTVFNMKQDLLLDNGTVQRLFQKVLEQAWASPQSFQPKDPEDRQGDGSDFRG